ncbi:MAG: threonine--tRNA ligase [Gammaproteobacteria bacterium]
MSTITLPDNSQRHFEKSVTVAEVAQAIGAGLARAALAGKVDGRLVDTSYVIDRDVELAIITDKDPEGLEIIRHSCAHLLAQAVKQLFPTAQITIGPVIEDGFYYDIAYQRPFTEDDLTTIEAKMHELAKADLPVMRTTMARDEAIAFFEQQGEHYKVQIIRDIPGVEELSFYQQGDFVDLCRGPHIPNTGKLKAFKLMKVAGAYWRGDSNNEMLQRIYGTAWPTKQALDEYLHQLEEAEKRDHRKIGKAQDLFHLQEEAPGMVFWHDKGWTMYQVLCSYMRETLREHNYQEVNTPQLVDRSLWELSGHWDKFGSEMFTTISENRDYAVKPMNCPCHVQIYNQALRSYRDLPLRMAEFGTCHRNELSGALHGLMRVRRMVQDDAHIFCTEDQIQQEVGAFINLLYKIYRDFGFDDIIIRLATRPEQRVGSDEIWDKAEQGLQQALAEKGLSWEVSPGEGAFYGPKIEFSLRDCIKRVWQCGTMQIDFSMPQRLGAHYIAADGSKQVPVMLHRAIFGTFERFLGILIEHYAGWFPVWLAPTQVMAMNITDAQQTAVNEVATYLKQKGIRVATDLRNEKIGFKIREHTLQRIPYLLVIGEREKVSGQVAVRTRTGQDLGCMSLEQFYQQLQADIAKRGRLD